MSMTKVRSKNGFEYYGEQMFCTWYWWYRPIGAKTSINLPGSKAKMEAHLNAPMLALNHFQASLDEIADVAGAQARLTRAQAYNAAVSSPEWDPGGRTNNPGKVARALQAASHSKDGISTANHSLERAIAMRELLTTTPFDVAAWLDLYHPSE